MAKEEPNVHTTVDARGCKPDLNLIHTYWRHTGNRNIYQLTGYCWHGDDDIWVIEFERFEGGIGTKYTRSITNFTEDRQGKPRFERVWGLNSKLGATYMNQAEIDAWDEDNQQKRAEKKPHHFTKETPIMPSSKPLSQMTRAEVRKVYGYDED